MMSSLINGRTNQLLGFPADARLLIINADDFGMCHAVNEAIIGTLEKGVVRSTTLMALCPWALHAMHFLSTHPQIPFGIHLTAISDGVDYRWGPITPKEKVPSLVAELRTIDPGGSHIRQADFEFLTSQRAKDAIEEEGIILLNYRALQAIWNEKKFTGKNHDKNTNIN